MCSEWEHVEFNVVCMANLTNHHSCTVGKLTYGPLVTWLSIFDSMCVYIYLCRNDRQPHDHFLCSVCVNRMCSEWEHVEFNVVCMANLTNRDSCTVGDLTYGPLVTWLSSFDSMCVYMYLCRNDRQPHEPIFFAHCAWIECVLSENMLNLMWSVWPISRTATHAPLATWLMDRWWLDSRVSTRCVYICIYVEMIDSLTNPFSLLIVRE